jgi:hypothetical protein
MYLREIERNTYMDFILAIFRKHHINIDRAALEFTVDFSRLHTFYTQSICNRLFASGEKSINQDNVRQVCRQLIVEHEPIFYQYRSLLTAIQWNLLRAIAREGKVFQPNSRLFLETYKLGTPSNIQRAIESLMNKEMIYRRNDSSGTFYSVYDVFLSRWMESLE